MSYDIMKKNRLGEFPYIMQVLRDATRKMTEPMSFTLVQVYGRNPFIILISCLLSLRAKDLITLPICLHLFQLYKMPQDFVDVPVADIERIIYKIGFYHKKAVVLKQVSAELILRFDGRVPSTRAELLSLPGVGIKTANLVLGVGFGIPAICVDTHVHRIVNRLGLVQTKTSEETERLLSAIVPQDYWIELNRLLIMWGQNICVPLSPKCLQCQLASVCPKKGVTRHR